MESKNDNMVEDKGVRIFIELGTSLQLEKEGTELSLKSDMIGMEVDRYLIVRVYDLEDHQIGQFENSPIVVKYFHKNAILGFQSKIIANISNPDNIFFLEYPTVIENYNIRNEQRFSCFMPVKLEIEYNVTEGTIVDITSDGCLCVVEGLKIVNEETVDSVIVYLQNSKLEYGFSFTGKIKSIRKDKDELNIGIKFTKMDSYTQAAIQTIIPALKFSSKTIL